MLVAILLTESANVPSPLQKLKTHSTFNSTCCFVWV